MNLRIFSALALILLFAGTAWSDELIVDVEFGIPRVERTADGDVVTLEDCKTIAHVGEPLLPVHGVSVVLPPGHAIARIDVEADSPSHLGDGYTPAVAQRQYPLSYDGPYETVSLKDEIRDSSAPFPAYDYANQAVHFLSGHGMGTFSLHPVKYIPETGTILYHSSMRVRVHTESNSLAQTAYMENFRGNETDRLRVERATAHQSALSAYPAPKDRDTDYDMLLITTDTFLPGFDEYIEYKTVRGWRILTETVSDIYASYTGQDNQEKIRNCIIDHYQNDGIEYVLLGGDDELIPHRGFWDDAGGWENEYDVAADLYYAGLDGNWNTDGDTKWGEAGEDDLVAEVFVGRVCIDNTVELQTFTDKTIMYEDSPVVAECDEALMVGELLWSSSGTYAKMYKEEIRLGADTWGYTTVGFPNPAQVDVLYDQDGTWSATGDLFPKLNAGVHFVNHLGHSDVGYMMKFYNSSVNTTNMTNNGVNHSFYITYSQGCYCGSFDNRNSYGSYESDCINEAMTLQIPTGSVAAIANSRYGWGSHGNTDGSSQYFDRQFFDAIFGEGITTIGWANQDSKEDNIWSVDYAQNRWCYYQLTVFGDPTLDMWTAEPTAMAVNHPSAYIIGEASFQVTASGVEGARVALSMDGVLYGVGFTDATGTAVVTFDSPPTTPGTMDVYVTAHDRLTHHGTTTVAPATGAYIVYRDHVIDDDESGSSSGDNDGEIELSETVEFGLQLDNVGSQAAYGVTAVLATTSPYVTMITDTQNFGDMASGAQVWAPSAYVFEIGNACPDQTVVQFEVQANAGADEWNSWVSVIVSAPVLDLQSFSVTEISGDGDGKPDPGETIGIDPVVINTGNGNAWNVNSVLTTASGYATVQTGSSGYGNIDPSGTAGPASQLTVSFDAGTPDAELVEFDLDMTCDGGYSSSASFTICVGQKPLLFVDTDNENTEDRITTALNNLGESYDTWLWYNAGSPGLNELYRYETIIWACGDQNSSTGTSQDRADLATYLDNGGALLFSAENYLSSYSGDSFTTEYLHIDSYETNVSVYDNAVGESGDPIGDGLTVTLSYHSDLSEYPDNVEPDAQSATVFRASGTNESCVIRYPATGTAAYRVLFFGAPLEAFSASGTGNNTIQGVLQRSLAWLRGSSDFEAPTSPPWVNLASDGTLSWGVSTDNTGVTGYRIYRHTDPFFDVDGLSWIRETTETSSAFPGSMGNPEINYYFVVTACDGAGNESDPSLVAGEYDWGMENGTP